VHTARNFSRNNSLQVKLFQLKDVFTDSNDNRAVPMIRAVAVKNARAKARRVAPWFNLVMIGYELFILVFCVPLLVLSVYRLPTLRRELKNKKWAVKFESTEQGVIKWNAPSAQNVIVYQAGLVLVDIPFFLMAAVITLLLWRAYFYWKDLIAQKDAKGRRKKTARHFGLLFVDVPCFIFALIIIALFWWRTISFIKSVLKEHKTGKPNYKCIINRVIGAARRKAVIRNLLGGLADIPFLFMGLIVTLFVWRAYHLWRYVVFDKSLKASEVLILLFTKMTLALEKMEDICSLLLAVGRSALYHCWIDSVLVTVEDVLLSQRLEKGSCCSFSNKSSQGI
jgi:hypothetical protein